MFRFANPHFLWLLAAVPALVALGWLSLRLRRRRMARFAAPALLGDLAPETAPGRLRLKFLLFVGAVGLLALAAARPQAGSWSVRSMPSTASSKGSARSASVWWSSRANPACSCP